MRSRTNDTVSVRAVHAHAATLIETHLRIQDFGHKCRGTVLIGILLFAAARMRSIFDACRRLRDAPSDQAVRDALVAVLPEMNALGRRINAGPVWPNCWRCWSSTESPCTRRFTWLRGPSPTANWRRRLSKCPLPSSKDSR